MAVIICRVFSERVEFDTDLLLFDSRSPELGSLLNYLADEYYESGVNSPSQGDRVMAIVRYVMDETLGKVTDRTQYKPPPEPKGRVY